jgi:hypothetical protein
MEFPFCLNSIRNVLLFSCCIVDGRLDVSGQVCDRFVDNGLCIGGQVGHGGLVCQI